MPNQEAYGRTHGDTMVVVQLVPVICIE